MAGEKRVVRDAVFSYTDPDGVLRMALRGETVAVDGADLDRGEKFGSFFLEEDLVDVVSPLDGALVGDEENLADVMGAVDLLDALRQRFGLAEDADPLEVMAAVGGELLGPVEPVTDELTSTGVVDSTDVQHAPVERPARAAVKQAWVDYVISLGADPAWASSEDTTKDELQAWAPAPADSPPSA